ncbi:hypothetical protein BJ322DRAFT_324851 [Thelephora terrestris]|uniref:Mid2 domain-containing protein n=1 Tax=Thelephora terrestris TaxID=56493 RepID=A0A9P6H6E1_9AGAM|nr:hypothetical protein BJ322DRAFT_324851 [Thelephora terrestris]
MRWSTLVYPVTLFYLLSLVNAIPHDVDVKRHWLHRRQDLTGSSSLSGPALSSQSGNPQGESSPVVSPTSQIAPSESLGPSSSLSSSISSPSPTPVQSSELPLQSTPASSGSVSPSLSSSSTSKGTPSRTSSTSSPTITNVPNNQVGTSYLHFSSTIGIPSDTLSADGNTGTGTGSGTSFLKSKAAMGSTFAIVGLVGVAIIVGAVFFLIKKIRQRKDEEDFDTYFEKLPASHSNICKFQWSRISS